MNMNTLIDIITRDIVILLFLVVVVFLLYEYAVYSEIKKHAYKVTCKVTCRQALRLHILALKIASRPVIIPGLCMYLLFLVTGFPLTLISISTNFSILLVMVSLLDKVWASQYTLSNSCLKLLTMRSWPRGKKQKTKKNYLIH